MKVYKEILLIGVEIFRNSLKVYSKSSENPQPKKKWNTLNLPSSSIILWDKQEIFCLLCRCLPNILHNNPIISLW